MSVLWAAGAIGHAMPGDQAMSGAAAPACAAVMCATEAPYTEHATAMSCSPVCASTVCAIVAEAPMLVVPTEPRHVTFSRPVSRNHVSRPEPYPPRVAELA